MHCTHAYTHTHVFSWLLQPKEYNVLIDFFLKKKKIYLLSHTANLSPPSQTTILYGEQVVATFFFLTDFNAGGGEALQGIKPMAD